MRRDPELVRVILELLEADGYVGLVSGYSNAEVGHHVYLLKEMGLIEAADDTAHGDAYPTAIPIRLKPAGHDALAKMRDEQWWNRAKKAALSAGGVLSIEALKNALLK